MQAAEARLVDEWQLGRKPLNVVGAEGALTAFSVKMLQTAAPTKEQQKSGSCMMTTFWQHGLQAASRDQLADLLEKYRSLPSIDVSGLGATWPAPSPSPHCPRLHPRLTSRWESALQYL